MWRYRPVLAFVGLGYVGLTTAVCFASRGFKVYGYDVDKEKVDNIMSGHPTFYEPGVDELLAKSLEEGNFRCVKSFRDLVWSSDVIFITVGTPSLPDGSTDLSFVEEASRCIGLTMRGVEGFKLVVVKSTVPPGTTEGLVKSMIESESKKTCGVDFGLCMNPEFLREGSAVYDTFNPDRIVIGEFDERSGEALEKLYKMFYGDNVPPILRTSTVNAELIKYASNAFLATKISFINMIARLCQKLPKADVTVVAQGMGLDRRIGPHFLRAGLGWGGSCFPKDVLSLINLGRKLGAKQSIAEAAWQVNVEQPDEAIFMAKMEYPSLRALRVAVLGLAFKPNTDDVRNAVSLHIINRLLEERAEVVVYDPAAMNNVRKIYGSTITYAKSPIDCIRDADLAIIVTEWDEFKELKPEDYKQYMRKPVVIDGRRIYDPVEYERLGVKMYAIGRTVHS